jgi:DNA-binding protein HU-beta
MPKVTCPGFPPPSGATTLAGVTLGMSAAAVTGRVGVGARRPRALAALGLLALVLGVIGLPPATPAGAADLVPGVAAGEVSAGGVDAASVNTRRLANQVAFTRARIASAQSQAKAVAKQHAKLKSALKATKASAKRAQTALTVTRTAIPKAKKAVNRAQAAEKELAADRARASKRYKARSKAAQGRIVTQEQRAAAARSAGKAEAKAAKKATKSRRAMATWQMAAVEEAYAGARSARAAELAVSAQSKLARAAAGLDLIVSALANARADISANKRTVKRGRTAVKQLTVARDQARSKTTQVKALLKRNAVARGNLKLHISALQGILVRLESKQAAARRARS